MSKVPAPVLMVNNDDIARYLGGIGDDTRRAILQSLELPKRRQHAVSELWAALGLEPEQPEEIRQYLIPDPAGKNALWDAARVAEEIGNAASTVNGWCAQDSLPPHFPPPLLDFSRKTRLWLPLEVRAYVQKSIYGDLARQVRRKPKSTSKPVPPAPVAWHGTLEPLPPADARQTKERPKKRIEKTARISRPKMRFASDPGKEPTSLLKSQPSDL